MKWKDITDFSFKNLDITVSDLLVALFIIIITVVSLYIIRRIVKRQQRRKAIDIGKSQAIFQIIKYLIWIIAIVTVLDTLEVKVTILIASSAALLVGLGLGIQTIFMDIVSGFTILFEGTIRVRDIVEIKDEAIGRVREIGLRTSKIETRDNIIMIIPNSKFINDNVINWSHLEKKTRFCVQVGVAYGSDVELVTKVLLNCAKDQKKIFDSPAPFVRFSDFGNSSLDFELYFWCSETFTVENVKSDLRYKINAAFKENNITIPFPQRDVHIKQ